MEATKILQLLIENKINKEDAKILMELPFVSVKMDGKWLTKPVPEHLEKFMQTVKGSKPNG